MACQISLPEKLIQPCSKAGFAVGYAQASQQTWTLHASPGRPDGYLLQQKWPGRPDHSASGTVLFYCIILKGEFVSALYGGSGFRLFCESLRILRNGSKHTRVIIRLEVNSLPVIRWGKLVIIRWILPFSCHDSNGISSGMAGKTPNKQMVCHLCKQDGPYHHKRPHPDVGN